MAEDVVASDRHSLNRTFPVLRILGAIRQAFDFRKILIAVMGLALLHVGLAALDVVLPSGTGNGPDVFSSLTQSWNHHAAIPDYWSWSNFVILHARISEPFRLVARAAVSMLRPGTGWREMTGALLTFVWLVVVWGICGGAIARITIVQIAALRQTSAPDAIRFAWSHAASLIGTPLGPLLGVASCALVGGLFGLLYHIPAIGSALAGIGLFVPLLSSLVMTLLLAGLLGGWPLFHAAIAGGADDALDALSRIFGYLNQRLGAFLVMVALTWAAGMFGLILVDLFIDTVLTLTQWNLELTAPHTFTDFFLELGTASRGGVAQGIHAFWFGVVRLLARAWVYSFFWTAAANLYLLLRHDVDGTPLTVYEPNAVPTPPIA